ncbi:MAG: ATP-binding protein [Pseudomonadota bacterium]|nr:ATP-binding protein [Pseudomonadota bacterium]
MAAETTGKISDGQAGYRFPISLQLYVTFGVFVGLTVLASLSGRYYLVEMDKIQKTITERHIPELSAAIQVGQESVALANIATRIRSASSHREVQEARTLTDAHSERLGEILQQLEAISAGEERPVLDKFKRLTQDLQQNLDELENSALISINIRQLMDERVALAVKTAREFDNLLVNRIDDQTFYLDTGWRSLTQKTPSSAVARLRNDGVNYYRSLLSLRAQIQTATNIMSEAVQYASYDMLQPLRERFEAALGTCARLLTSIKDKKFAAVATKKYEIIRTLGAGDNKLEDTSGELFAQMASAYTEEQKQESLLQSNADIVSTLALKTEDLIDEIQDKSKETSEHFSDAIIDGRNIFLAVNIATIIFAFFVGFIMVRKHLIGRIKRLSSAMLTMSKGNLKTSLDLSGNDEISDMANSLEVFRKYAFEAQKLELVEKLAKEVQHKNSELENVINKLKQTQQQVVMQEKLASLGQLTSGIAHEIKNPLNFITNFSLVSKDLLEDISRELADIGKAIEKESRDFIEEVLRDLYGNMEKINFHGQRANDIVKGMLQHSRGGDVGGVEEIDFHRFLDSTVNLAYQGKRSGSKDFNVDIKKNYGDAIDKVKLNPQDMSRVVLNVVTNACDALDEKSKNAQTPKDFSPTIWIETAKVGSSENPSLMIKVRDNGPGVPEKLAKKIFDPFFTTKPTDKGTGLGLSLSHDIVAKHNGTLKLKRLDEGTEFTIEIPIA